MLKQLNEEIIVRFILGWENWCSEKLNDLFRGT